MTDHDPISTEPRRGLATWLSTGFGFGFSPFAPGTVGALWGLPLAWAIQQIPGWGWQVAVIGALLIVGVPLCTAAARELGGKKDPGAVVFDEIATVPITFFLVPLDASQPGSFLLTLAAGFALHRLFDITKPPPARQLEALPEGLGIMADDVAAALYSRLALQILLWGTTFWI